MPERGFDTVNSYVFSYMRSIKLTEIRMLCGE